MEVSKSWPGVPKALWPSLNKLADAVNTALNWRTDGSLVVQAQGGQMTATIQLPQTLQAMILGGSNPYSWAAVTPDDDGVWYIDSVQGLSGQAPNQVVSLINSASWSAGTLTFECQDDVQALGVTAGTTVKVRGVNPIDFDDDTYVVTAVHENTFDVLVAVNPGTYVIGGAACFDVTGATEFRPAWEYNLNPAVQVGQVVDIDVRTMNSDTDQEYEYKFPYQQTNSTGIFIQDEGVTLPQQPILNFIGTPVRASNDPLNSRTNVVVECCGGTTNACGTLLVEKTTNLTLNSAQTALDVNDSTAFYINPAVNFAINGFRYDGSACGGNSRCGKVIEIFNVGTANNNIVVNSGASNASSQDQYSGYQGQNDVIGPKSSATYFYDCVNERWVKKGGSGTAGGTNNNDYNYYRHIGVSIESWYFAGVDNPDLYPSGAVQSQAPAGATLYAAPYIETRGGTLDRIGINVTNISGGTAKVRLGIYEAVGPLIGNLAPGTKVLDAGEITITTSGIKTINIGQYLKPGLYWFVFIWDGNGSLFNIAVTEDGSGQTFQIWSPLGADATWNTWQTGWRGSLVYGALPATFPAPTVWNYNSSPGLPLIGVRYSN